MAAEALACFTSLLENVPGWIADLESILETAAKTQEDVVFANIPADSHTTSSKKRPQTKSSSLKSRRSDDGADVGLGEGNKAILLKRPHLQHMTNSDALLLSQRKRKTASVCSGDQSGPPKFRIKAAAVVYYDGDTQKSFEKLVRAVGSSRNAIRKGKMSMKVDSMSQSESSGSETSSGDDGQDFDPIMARLALRAHRSTRPAHTGEDNSEAFDRVDGRLEKGQSLCERAAHQILRDGDCTAEVNDAKKHFSEALKLAQAELPALQRIAEHAAERRRRSEERRRLEKKEEARRQSVIALNPNVIEVITAARPDEDELEVDQLEVDDCSNNDDDDAGFDISTFSKIAQMRSARLTAY
ncbi:Hypothetical predicted protein [Lecanosticta acicola]|uniref:Uncharacterized protein n=1 Tax=Lecanosticta acicola TaxID=111012 RepID=A0AAI8Z121_9PEZI|nr:Hypothetical predicted protein [Lecanosticta acicola]